MLEMLNAFCTIIGPFWTFGLATLATAVALFCALRLYFVVKDRSAFKKGTLTCRSGAFALTAALAMILWLGGCGAADQNKADIPEDNPDPPVVDAADTPEPPAPEIEPEFEPEPLAEIILTERQMENYLSHNGFSVIFDDSSTASRLRERVEATGKYGDPVEGALDFPYVEVMERLDDLKAGKLSDAELDVWLKDVRHTLYQKVIANPMIGDGWARLLAENPLVTANNQWLLDDFVAKMDEFRSIKQNQEISNSDILENKEPGLIPAGIDYCLAEENGETVVNKWYRFNAIRICYLLDNLTITGEITEKTTVRNMCYNMAAEDSYSGAMFSPTQENEPSLRMVARQKALNGKSQVVLEYGLNPKDGRLNEYDPKAKEPVPVAPVVPTEPAKPKIPVTPKPDPKPEDPEPQLPKETYSSITYVHKLRGTEEVIHPDVTRNGLVVGSQDVYNVPEVNGYVREQSSVTTQVTSTPQTVPVWYVKKAPDKYPLSITYVFAYPEVDGTLDIPAHFELLEEKAHFRVVSPDKVGYHPDKKIVEGDMPAAAYSEEVKYYPNEYEQIVEHRNAKTGEKMPGLRDHTETVLYKRNFYYVAPQVAGYTADPSVISETIYGDNTWVIWYTPKEVPKLPDGQGGKDPKEDPVNTDDAPIGGGPNQPGDGAGNEQPNEPDRNDYPDEGDNGNAGTPDKGDSGNATVTPPQDPNGGFTDNGDIPETPPVTVDPGTSIDDPSIGDHNTPIIDEPINDGYIPDP